MLLTWSVVLFGENRDILFGCQTIILFCQQWPLSEPYFLISTTDPPITLSDTFICPTHMHESGFYGNILKLLLQTIPFFSTRMSTADPQLHWEAQEEEGDRDYDLHNLRVMEEQLK